MKQITKNTILKKVIIAGSLMWIVVSVIGIRLCFNLAKESRKDFVATISSYDFQTAIPAILQKDPTVEEQIRQVGLEGRPYLFSGFLMKVVLLFMTCLLVSLFVLYSVLKLEADGEPWTFKLKTSTTSS